MSASEWMSGLSRKARVGLVVSVVWLILVVVNSSEYAFSYLGTSYAVSGPRFVMFGMHLLTYGILPIALCWGIWWVLRKK